MVGLLAMLLYCVAGISGCSVDWFGCYLFTVGLVLFGCLNLAFML